jgi:Lipocalin-like domain
LKRATLLGAKWRASRAATSRAGLFLTDSGLLSVQIIADFPKLASKDRLKTTPAEDKAVAHGVLCFFGTYTVSEASRQIVFHIERSTFPNQATGKGFARRVTLTGDELRLDSPGQTVAGGQTFVIVWKRMHQRGFTTK